MDVILWEVSAAALSSDLPQNQKNRTDFIPCIVDNFFSVTLLKTVNIILEIKW